ncbi:hypothetical protein BDA99DRAFT_537809 [Phascolomyces articulosus]|uniref:Uncharacterized protein n=1 Tax=Phascolomyces articulosus TaxID=60185 RepID=A0AAD5K992_9FUNG|nr:hypothetical protein BDA99DRAFT_537809 [Phascolomyces articulosus]
MTHVISYICMESQCNMFIISVSHCQYRALASKEFDVPSSQRTNVETNGCCIDIWELYTDPTLLNTLTIVKYNNHETAGLGASFALETLPLEAWGLFSGIYQQGYACGYLLAALVNFAVSDTDSTWQTVFWKGTTFILLAIAIRFFVPESKTFKKAKETPLSGKEERIKVFSQNFYEDEHGHGIVNVKGHEFKRGMSSALVGSNKEKETSLKW